VSTDGGATFRWVANWGPYTASMYDAQLSPLVATGPGSGGPNYNTLYSSVWVGWLVNAHPYVMGALVTGSLDPNAPNPGTIGAFSSPAAPPAPGYWAPYSQYYMLGGGSQLEGLSVGPNGQPLISYQDWNPITIMVPPPPPPPGSPPSPPPPPTMEQRWIVYTTAA